MKGHVGFSAAIVLGAFVVSSCGTDRPMTPSMNTVQGPARSSAVSPGSCGQLTQDFSGFRWIVYGAANAATSDMGMTQWDRGHVCMTTDGGLAITMDRTKNADWFKSGNVGLRALTAAGIDTAAVLSYGNYTYAIDSLPTDGTGGRTDFDPNAVVGLFSYAGPSGSNEIDVELTGGWGPTWLHYNIWSGDNSGNFSQKLPTPPVTLATLAVPSSHWYNWQSGSVTFGSAAGSPATTFGPFTTSGADAGHVPSVPMGVYLQTWMQDASKGSADPRACSLNAHMNPNGKSAGPQWACGPWTVTIRDVRLPVPLDLVGGNAQEAAPGATLTQPLTVLVHDALGHRMPGVTVDFTPAPGSGSVGQASGVSDGQGRVSTTWTLGTSGNQSVQARVRNGTLDPVTFTATFIPVIHLSGTTLHMTTVAGTAAPSQSVAITNGVDGVLDGLGFGAITYGSGAGWLSASLDGTSAPAVATVTATA